LDVYKQHLLEGALRESDSDYDVMLRAASLVSANSQEIQRFRGLNLMERYGRHDSDTGSSEVQIALITERLRNLEQHLKQHHKDKPTRRSQRALLVRRRALFFHLKKTNFPAYERVIRDTGVTEASLQWR